MPSNNFAWGICDSEQKQRNSGSDVKVKFEAEARCVWGSPKTLAKSKSRQSSTGVRVLAVWIHSLYSACFRRGPASQVAALFEGSYSLHARLNLTKLFFCAVLVLSPPQVAPWRCQFHGFGLRDAEPGALGLWLRYESYHRGLGLCEVGLEVQGHVDLLLRKAESSVGSGPKWLFVEIGVLSQGTVDDNPEKDHAAAFRLAVGCKFQGIERWALIWIRDWAERCSSSPNKAETHTGSCSRSAWFCFETWATEAKLYAYTPPDSFVSQPKACMTCPATLQGHMNHMKLLALLVGPDA